MNYKTDELLYDNPLSCERDTEDFIMEGDGSATFPLRRMRLESTRPPEDAQEANIVFWCPVEFPDNIEITWKFWPIKEPGLAILFFSATGINGEDIFASTLDTRTGPYRQYHHGDINALHVSYFRRNPNERILQTFNLRKSYGFHLVAQGADPIPPVIYAEPPYKMKTIKSGPGVLFFINDIRIFHWTDDGKTYGPVLGPGKIGFRQMVPFIAEYADLQVRAVIR